MVDRELRRIARRCLDRSRWDPILDSAALVNEAYVRLIGAGQSRWQDRAHFFAVCSQIMRRLAVDHARARQTAKRGGGAQSVPFYGALSPMPEPLTDLVALDDSLSALAGIDPRKSKVVELRFFCGLSVDETAEVLRVSPETVRRDWRMAKAWLLREMGGERHSAGPP